MRSGPRCLIRTAVASAAVAAALLAAAPDAHGDPHGPVIVSCPGGYLAPSLRDCPPVPKHLPPPAGHGGGGRGFGGLLGGLLGGLGL